MLLYVQNVFITDGIEKYDYKHSCYIMKYYYYSKLNLMTRKDNIGQPCQPLSLECYYGGKIVCIYIKYSTFKLIIFLVIFWKTNDRKQSEDILMS